MTSWLSMLGIFNVEFGLIAGIVALLFLDIVLKNEKKHMLGNLSIGLVIYLLILHLSNGYFAKSMLFQNYILDNLSFYFKAFFLLTSAFVLVMSRDYIHRFERGQSEFYILILLATLGMIIIASTLNFILLFVALEMVTISFYIMTTYLRTDAKSIEAGLKYLILGSLSAGFLLYGISFLYGITGSTDFPSIVAGKAADVLNSKGLLLGFLLIFVGLGFKIAAAPFHFWIPDVYEGAPTPITAFLSVGSKATGFLILIRLLTTAFKGFQHELTLIFSILSAITLFYGNLGAIPQKNIKRFMGYSSIGHAGYLLMGLAAGNELGLSGVLYYLAGYLFTNLGAFIIIILFSNATNSDEMADYTGLSQRSPLLAAAMLISLMSLAGIPPLAGFFGKFLLISAAVKSGLVWLAFLGAANVVISLYYYLVLVKRMYIHEPVSSTPIAISLPMRLGIIASIIGILALGIFQEPFLKLADLAVKGLF